MRTNHFLYKILPTCTHTLIHTHPTLFSCALSPVIVLIPRTQNYFFATQLSHGFKKGYKILLSLQKLFLVVSNNLKHLSASQLLLTNVPYLLLKGGHFFIRAFQSSTVKYYWIYTVVPVMLFLNIFCLESICNRILAVAIHPGFQALGSFTGEVPMLTQH